MRVLFNLMTTIEVPDADKFPPKVELEEMLKELLMLEGMVAHGLEVTNYRMSTEEV